MPLITDPDSLSQGFKTTVADLAFTASAGANTTLTGAATLPAIATGEFFEIRGATPVGNNGLYIATGVPTTSSVPCTKVVGANPVNDAAASTDIYGKTGAANEKSVHLDIATRTYYLLEQGNLDAAGVQMRAFYSFLEEEWKSDPDLIKIPFPMVGISFAAGQWQFGVDPSGNYNGWKPAEDNATHSIYTRRLHRDAGWDEFDANGNVIRKYANITTLPTSGAFEDPADLAYYFFGTAKDLTTAKTDYEYAGEVNEPVKFFEEFGNPPTCAFPTTSTITRASGSFVTDGYVVGGQVTVRNADQAGNNGTFVLTAVAALTLTVTGTPLTVDAADTNAQLAVNNDNVFRTNLRVRDGDTNGKTFSTANLAAGGETALTSKIIKLGLGNITDIDIDETDANIAANSPYTEIEIRYLAAAYNREVDSATPRDFGIIVDVGTYSQSNGVSNGTTLFTSANIGAITLGDYTGGSLIVHEGAGKGTYTISGTPVNNAGTLEITTTSAVTGSASSLSFTLQRATPIVATKKQIYEKVQYALRQNSDIDGTSGTVIGTLADLLAAFVGPDLKFGEVAGVNPNGGGAGVLVEGFDANDTNNLKFWDNGGTQRTYPFVAAGNINVNQAVVDDASGEAWLFFEYTRRTTSATIDCTGNSGATYDLESDAGQLPALSVNDFIYISGFAQAANNGIFYVTAVNTSQADYTVRKWSGAAVGTTETNQTVSVDENPYESPDAIIVNDNAGSPIAFAVNQLSTPFTFDYDNNAQGGRTPGTNAQVVLIAAGEGGAQMAVVTGLTITASTGLSFSITAAQERNFLNPV